jgi:hypothetical protein
MQSYPLTLIFDLWAVLPNKITIKDLADNTLMRVDRALTLKHKVEVTNDQASPPEIYQIEAENLTINPAYDIRVQGQTIGRIKRQAPWWKCRYNIYDGSQLMFTIAEATHPRSLTVLWLMSLTTVSFIIMTTTIPSLRLLGIAIFGLSLMMFMMIGTSHLCNPTYIVKRANGEGVMQFAKVPSWHLHRSKFSIKAITTLNDAEESKALLGIILLILRERAKS